MAESEETKTCPLCAETIKAAAKVCPHCRQYCAQIVVLDSSMNYSRSGSNAYITVVGVLSNASPYSWKEVQVEAQFFDQAGKLIDARSDREFDATILSGSPRAFRVRGLAARTEEAYASHKVFVRAAKDARRWP